MLYITEKETKQYLQNKINSQSITHDTVMSKEEFLQKFYFTYQEEAVFFLVKKYLVTREIALIYLQNLYFLPEEPSSIDKIKFLQQLKQELITHNLLIYSPLFRYKLQHTPVCFYHIFLKNQDYYYLKEEVSKITTVQEENTLSEKRTVCLYKAKNPFMEAIGVCNQICSLLNQNISPSQIYVTNLNETSKEALKLYGSFYGLNFQFSKQKEIYSTKLIQEFLKRKEENWNILLPQLQSKYSHSLDQEVFKKLITTLNKYITFKKDKTFYNYLTEVIKTLSIPNIQYQEAIKELSFTQEEVDKDAYIFLLGANQGQFPTIEKDLKYFTDKDYTIMKRSTSLDNNLLKKEALINLVNYYPNLVLSYCESDLTQELYLANICEQLTIETKEFTIQKENSLIYTSLAFASSLDTYYKYGIINTSLKELYQDEFIKQYRSYHHEFKNIGPITIPNKTLSYSSIDIYNRCPYRFYLQNVLKIKDYQTTYFIQIGNLVHHILQKFYEPNFDFEQTFQTELQSFPVLTKKEQFFLQRIKRKLSLFIDNLKRQEENSKVKNVLCEQTFEVEFPNNYKLHGVIDKIYYDNQSLVLLDYKTGGFSLELQNVYYGLDLQLPIYLYLLKHSPWQNHQIIGFYFQKVFPPLVINDDIHTKEELERKELMLQGYSIDLESELLKFDPNYANSQKIKGLKQSKNGFYAYSKIINDDGLTTLVQIVSKVIEENIQKINAGEFPIAPKQIGKVLKGCEYCPYSTVCYHTEEDIIHCEEIKNPSFLGGEENGLD